MQTAVDQDSVCGVIGFQVSGWRFIWVLGLWVLINIHTKPTTYGFETETISRQEQKPSEMQTAVDQESVCGVIGLEVSGWRLYVY